jgi:hypothetical protein
MLLDREPSGLSHSSSSSSTPDHLKRPAAAPAVDESEQQTDGGSDLEHGDDEEEPVKRVVFNIADTSPEPEHLSPDKSTLTFAPQRLVYV